ncbi:hypothetical protein GCM10010360_19110 [Streptomyces nogalater]
MIVRDSTNVLNPKTTLFVVSTFARVAGPGTPLYRQAGYRVWDRAGRTPTYPFGHGLGCTDWAEPGPDRPARRPAAFASAGAGPGESAEATVELPRRAFEVWDETTKTWAYVKGSYEISAGRSITGRRRTAPINV